MVLLLAGVGFFATGCYDDPGYYGHRPVRAGYYASYGDPYYGYDPYGYGYGPGVGVGVYRSRPAYVRRPYYARRDYYRRGGYYRRSGDRREWDRRGSGDRRRNIERRGRRDRDRDRAIRRSTAPDQQPETPEDTRLE